MIDLIDIKFHLVIILIATSYINYHFSEQSETNQGTNKSANTGLISGFNVRFKMKKTNIFLIFFCALLSVSYNKYNTK